MKVGKDPVIDEDGEVRELKGADFKHARKASEALPKSLQAKLGLRAKKVADKEDGSSSSPRLKESASPVGEARVLRNKGERVCIYNVEGESWRHSPSDLKISFETLFSDYVSLRKAEFPRSEHLQVGLLLTERVAPYHVNLDVFEHLVHNVASRYSVDNVNIRLLLEENEPLDRSHKKLEEMSKSEMVMLVQMQSELLERLKVLYAVVTGDDLVTASTPAGILSDDVHRAMLAKRLREIAEDVEMSGSPARKSQA
ncbi:hypothetical protein [Pseudomonas aeruginosa]|uniref:hypothetical protein n=1 Tax=Pseudomonas aeruginosa TaxID=287 RepID=UPI0029DA2EB2|nr:hypothetical protein [Pseudomonas aeruginosa]WNO25009.1 hypothetical protein NKJIMNAM_00028 [Pseudomonas phage LPPA36]HCL3981716.1 hypothetical protein [Pseudomonas aeruginosa]HCR1282577.1 hypothetical protein [Pseudomonas aeruginosa]HEJ3081944.1 hypothetical protein [Pseudomonas aeruginosa]